MPTEAGCRAFGFWSVQSPRAKAIREAGNAVFVFMSMTISHEQTVAIALELNRELARALQRCDEACELGEELAVLGQRWKEAARTVMTDAQFAEYEKAIEQPSPTLGEK